MIKKIGIIGAMEEEVEALRGKLTYVKTTSRASMDFYAGKMGNKEVVIVRSGIGKVNAGICTQILADLFQVDVSVIDKKIKQFKEQGCRLFVLDGES